MAQLKYSKSANEKAKAHKVAAPRVPLGTKTLSIDYYKERAEEAERLSEKLHHKKEQEERVGEIRYLFEKMGFKHKEIAEAFDMDRRRVARICKYYVWAHVLPKLPLHINLETLVAQR